MLIADPTGETLATLKEKVDDHSESTAISADSLLIDLTSDNPHIGINGIEVPVTTQGINALGSYFGVPSAFLDKIEQDEREWIITRRKERTPGLLSVRYTDGGVTGAYAPGQKVINPSRLVGIAERVIDPSAPVVSMVDTNDDFVFDVVAPLGFDRGVVQVDEEVEMPEAVLDLLDLPEVRRVGDITSGGIRIGYDRKRNLAPWVSSFSWRLACTNGQEVMNEGLRVDARAAESVDDVLAELEAMAETAFAAVEGQIRATYDLRQQRVDNPERLIHRLGREHRLSPRVVNALVAAAPTLGDNPTEFDVLNLITNAANAGADNPRRFGARRNLQIVGGSIVSKHVERCTHCSAKIV